MNPTNAETRQSIDDWMPDKNLQVEVANELGKSVADVTPVDMENITYLYLYEKNISNLKGLEFAVNLVELNASNNHLTQIDALSGLTKLITLSLNRNQVSDISPLQNLIHLQAVYALGNQIQDLSPLGNLNELTELTLNDNLVSDIGPISHLPNLVALALSENLLTDVSEIRNLTKLMSLELSSNQLTEVNGIGNLVLLKSLFLAGNQLSDISELSQLVNLDYFQIGNQRLQLSEIVAKEPTYFQPNIVKGPDASFIPLVVEGGNGEYSVEKVGINWKQLVSPSGVLASSWSQDVSIGHATSLYNGVINQPYLIDQTTIEAQDSVIYVGENWQPKDNFISAIDREGNQIAFENIVVTGTVDTQKAGNYEITYSYGGVSKTITVTVKEDQTVINAKNSTIYVGEDWQAKDNFISAIDREGNQIAFKDIHVVGTVDTTKTGENEVTYTYNDVSKTVVVTVKEKDSIGEIPDGNSMSQLPPNGGTLPKTGEESAYLLFFVGITLVLAVVFFKIRRSVFK